jgi:hypothetical protein
MRTVAQSGEWSVELPGISVQAGDYLRVQVSRDIAEAQVNNGPVCHYRRKAPDSSSFERYDPEEDSRL